MTTSGWCSTAQGCTSARAHATCGDRIARGLLAGCDCAAFGGHVSPVVDSESRSEVRRIEGSAWENGDAALTANKAVRPRRKTGAGPTITDLESE